MRPSVRKWLLRLTVALVTLLIVGVVTVQIVLNTDIPRQIVVAQLENKLRLRVTAKSLSTGWLGNTELRDVTMSLPLAKESFLSATTLRVSHTNLPALLLGRALHIHELQFDKPELLVRQGESGRWNLQEVADLLGRAGGGKQGASEAAGEQTQSVVLPAVKVNDGLLRIIDKNGKQARLEPLTAACGPDGPLVWTYKLEVGGELLHINGRLVPGVGWQHVLSISIAKLGPAIEPWMTGSSPATQKLVDNAVLKADWQGIVRQDGKVGGLLTLSRLTTGESSADAISVLGAFAIDIGGGAIRAMPQNVTVHGLPQTPADLKLQNGVIAFSGAGVQIDNLSGVCAGGRVSIDQTHVGLADGSADLHLRWQDVIAPKGVTQSGSLSASLRCPWPRQPLIHAELTSSGTVAQGAQGKWDAKLKLDGRGTSWDTITWEGVAERLRLERRRQSADLDGLGVKVIQTPHAISLANLDLPAGGMLNGTLARGSLGGQAGYEFDKKNWWLYLAGQNWRAGSSTPAQFQFRVSGDRDKAILQDVYLTLAGVQYSAEGEYRFDQNERPVKLDVYAFYPPFAVDPYHSSTPIEGGLFESTLHVRGDTEPLSLQADGRLEGTNLRLKHHPLGNVDLKMHLLAQEVTDATGASLGVHIRLDPADLLLFNGKWIVRGDYASETNSAKVGVTLNEMSMKQLDAFVNPPPSVDGSITGGWTINLPGLNIDRMEINGPLRIANLKTKGFTADTIDAALRVGEGTVWLEDIIVRRNYRGTERQLTAGVSFPLRSPDQIALTAKAAGWPLELSVQDVDFEVFGQIDNQLDLNLGTGGARGSVTLDVHAAYKQLDLGLAKVQATLRDRVLEVNGVNAPLFGGTVTLTGSVDRDDLLKSRAYLTIVGLDASQLSMFDSRLQGLQGKFTGLATLSAPDSSRPLAPLQLRLSLVNEGGAYRSVPIGSINLLGYYDDGRKRDEFSEANERLLVDGAGDAPNNPAAKAAATSQPALGIELAGGKIRPWARLTRHPGEKLWATQLNLQFDKIQLNPFVRMVDPKHEPMPGELNGQAMLVGEPRDKSRFFGDATVKLEHSDLANYSVISSLYDLMSIKFFSTEPAGRGTIAARLEGPNLNITRFYYFNRGVEARATGTVFDIWNMPDSKLIADVVGSVRPLRDLKLPFIADVDKLLTALQGTLATIHVEGTVHDPKIRSVPFAGISSSLRELILGDVRPATEVPGGK